MGGSCSCKRRGGRRRGARQCVVSCVCKTETQVQASSKVGHGAGEWQRACSKPADSKMKRDRVFAMAKGFRGKAKNCFRVANPQVEEALEHQYADRKILKRDMRALWIQRINAGTREHGLKYGDFIHGQKLANVALDRKILADLAVTEPFSFKKVVDMARDALMAKHSA